MAGKKIQINRAPVLTLWASVVAGQLGYDEDEALTMGKAVAGLNAQAKARRLGIVKPSDTPEGKRPKAKLGEELWIEVCGRAVPCKQTEDGIRAVVKDKPIDPDAVRRYLESKFGDDLDAVRSAMETLSSALSEEELADEAYGLYEQFRPEIPKGKRGWGAKGALDLSYIESLAGDGG